jgi:hypothetical protein
MTDINEADRLALLAKRRKLMEDWSSVQGDPRICPSLDMVTRLYD